MKSQVFNRHLFYENIQQMNNNIWKYIVQNTNQDFIYDSTIEKEEPIDNSDDVLID